MLASGSSPGGCCGSPALSRPRKLRQGGRWWDGGKKRGSGYDAAAFTGRGRRCCVAAGARARVRSDGRAHVRTAVRCSACRSSDVRLSYCGGRQGRARGGAMEPSRVCGGSQQTRGAAVLARHAPTRWQPHLADHRRPPTPTTCLRHPSTRPPTCATHPPPRTALPPTAPAGLQLHNPSHQPPTQRPHPPAAAQAQPPTALPPTATRPLPTCTTMSCRGGKAASQARTGSV